MLLFRPIAALIVVAIWALSLPTPLGAVDFAHKIMPVLKQHCGNCHAGEKKEGGLSMNTRAELLAGGENGKVVVSGDAANSRLMAFITSDDEGERMPPEGPRISPDQIAAIKQWINEGLPWDDGVALGKAAWEPPLAPRLVELPPARDGREHPIDRLLDAYLAEQKQETPAPISDAEFFRRASLDAVGLLPTPEELKAFVADTLDDKRERLIARLLADDIAYADHWLTTWNDLLRNDYTGTGFITGGRKQITPWLYASLRENKPYDQFVRELIAPTQESAGFIDGIQWRGEVNASQSREIQFAQNISQVFLGINMKCASCHDSFIDRWTLSEAYNLAAIYSDKSLELHRCDKPTAKTAQASWMFPEIGDVDPKAPKAQRLQQLARLMTHPENGRFTRTLVNRIWHRLMGRGIVHPVDAMNSRPFNEDLLDYLAVRFASDGYDLRKLMRHIMTSQAYQSRTVILEAEPGDDFVYAGPIARRMTAEQLIDSIWQITGAHPAKPEANVDRAPAPQAVSKEKQSSQPVPIKAKWIWHDGNGSTKATFRKSFELGAAPADAVMLVTCDNAFTMKINGVEVATSNEWSRPVRRYITADLSMGKNVIEVAAEMFGGAAGFICQIVLTDGEKQLVITTDKTWEVRKPDADWAAAVEIHPYGAGPWKKVLDASIDANNDGPQTPPVRAALVKNDFLMRSLGRPHRDQVVTTRPGELTTLQAIDLSNGEILSGYLNQGAKRITVQGKPANELIDWLYRYALSRQPTDDERAVLLEIVGDARDPVAVEDLLWSVVMLPEFQIIR